MYAAKPRRVGIYILFYTPRQTTPQKILRRQYRYRNSTGDRDDGSAAHNWEDLRASQLYIYIVADRIEVSRVIYGGTRGTYVGTHHTKLFPPLSLCHFATLQLVHISCRFVTRQLINILADSYCSQCLAR